MTMTPRFREFRSLRMSLYQSGGSGRLLPSSRSP
jgi:hypothetical protein